MTTTQHTRSATETDLAAKIHAAIQKAFPLLPTNSLRHEITFSLRLGHTVINIDAAKDLTVWGRADVLVYFNDTPLALFELKRRGVALTKIDEEQGLSYANLHRPRFPLVVITNGDETRFLEAHSGARWQAASRSEQDIQGLIAAASRAATVDLKDAVNTLMISSATVWTKAVRRTSQTVLDDLTGAWGDALMPFVQDFFFPRKLAAVLEAALEDGQQFVLVKGAPLVGKSNLLRELVLRTDDSDKFAVLFVSADEGSGIFQAVADALAAALAWPVTSDEAREWLRRVSYGRGPTLVLAVDGITAEHEQLRHHIEDLSSKVFGPNLRLVVTADDTVAEKLLYSSNKRQKSAIGRRFKVVLDLDLLDDDEFDAARNALWGRRMGILDGGKFSPELRVPWVLRSLGSRYAPDPGEQPDKAVLLPSLLSIDLVLHTRKRFNDAELLRLFRGIAKAVLRDAEDTTRPISLTLESIASFVVRHATLCAFLAPAEIERLVQGGYLNSRQHASNEAILVVRLPELLASEIAKVVGAQLIERARGDAPAAAASWLARLASNLPLGDIIAAQSFADATRQGTGVPFGVISSLLDTPPKLIPMRPGTRFAMHVEGLGCVDMTLGSDGSFSAEIEGRRYSFDPDDDEPALVGDAIPWLILSHLAGFPIPFEREHEIHRLDLQLLLKVGTCAHILRRPDVVGRAAGIRSHQVPGYGDIACHENGIVEPITFSMFRILCEDGPDLDEWIGAAIAEDSLALLTRLDIALRAIALMADDVKRPWAERTLRERVAPALRFLLERLAA